MSNISEPQPLKHKDTPPFLDQSNRKLHVLPLTARLRSRSGVKLKKRGGRHLHS